MRDIFAEAKHWRLQLPPTSPLVVALAEVDDMTLMVAYELWRGASPLGEQPATEMVLGLLDAEVE